MHRLAVALALSVLAGCTNDESLLAPEPMPGDRPPPVDRNPRPSPEDPQWKTFCGTRRLQTGTGGCLETTADTATLVSGFDQQQVDGSDTRILVSSPDPITPAADGSYATRMQELELRVPTEILGAETTALPLEGTTLTLRWIAESGERVTGADGSPAGFNVTRETWYWRADRGTATCRAEGRRFLCEFRDAHFSLGEGPERPGGPPPSTRPAPLATSLDTQGWVHVAH